jgi:hypothetical protein
MSEPPRCPAIYAVTPGRWLYSIFFLGNIDQQCIHYANHAKNNPDSEWLQSHHNYMGDSWK